MFSDIDECSSSDNPCHEQADCQNTDGSFQCTCKEEYSGDGRFCKRKYNVALILNGFDD